MYTRCFERPLFDRYTGKECVETVNISEYGFEWYIDNKLVKTGCVENINEDIESLLNEGFEEVV